MMSVKANAFLAAAAAALGVTIDATAGPVAEGLLNDFTCTTFGFAEVDSSGRVLAVVSIDTGEGVKVRPIADSLGNVKLFSSADGAVAMSKRTKMSSAVPVVYKRFVSVGGSVGDPVAALKSKYKASKLEEATAIKQQAVLAQKIASAVALGWDVATGTPEGDEHADLVKRADTVDEWKGKTTDRKTALAASLTAAGIDPLTVV